MVQVLLNPCLESFLFFFPHPEPPFLLPPHTIPLGRPSAQIGTLVAGAETPSRAQTWALV